jgi:hypothetical protein
VGIYYKRTQSGGVKTPAEVSAVLDGYGWTSSWRASDADETLWYATDAIGTGYLIPAFPWEFIIETSTMKMVAITSIGSQLNILAELAKIE